MEVSVSPAQQSRAPAVVRHSRLGLAIAGLWLSLHPVAARADGYAPTASRKRTVVSSAPKERAEKSAEERPPATGDYGAALGAAYLVAPLLALAVGAGVSGLSGEDGVAVLSGCSMFLLPSMVHAANGESGRAAAAVGTMTLFTGLGVLGGGALGYASGAATCDEETSDCDFAWLGLMIVGALLGGVVGYTANAVVDTEANSDLSGEQDRENSVSITPWVMPIAEPPNSREGTGRGFSGASLGATITW
jgi:hypothetical protein